MSRGTKEDDSVTAYPDQRVVVAYFLTNRMEAQSLQKSK